MITQKTSSSSETQTEPMQWGSHVCHHPFQCPPTTGSPGRSSGAVVLKQLLIRRFQVFLSAMFTTHPGAQTKENLPWILSVLSILKSSIFSDIPALKYSHTSWLGSSLASEIWQDPPGSLDSSHPV